MFVSLICWPRMQELACSATVQQALVDFRWVGAHCTSVPTDLQVSSLRQLPYILAQATSELSHKGPSNYEEKP